MKPLREYQSKMVSDARASLAAGNRCIVVQSPTGSGKTRVISEIVKLATAKRRRVLLLAPRRELIYQIRDSLADHGVFSGTIMAGEHATATMDVQVASFDTLHARGVRTERMAMPPADVVIVDECHISLAKSRREVLSHYSEATIIGFTATPARGDGKGLGAVYDDLIIGPSVRSLTESGFLVPARYFAPSKPDLAGVSLDKDGDYQQAKLGEVMDQPILTGDIVENWLRLAPKRRTVVFCVNCAHSRHVTAAFCAAGIAAEHLDGETPAADRRDILERVSRGSTQVLCNVFVASYGLDIPALDCAVLARPTKNLTLYMQTVGRVLRPFAGKSDALIIDHSGAVAENGMVDDYVPWSLEDSKVKDRKDRAQKDAKAAKELECSHCHTVFRGARNCPSCGYQVIPQTQEIPFHKADLVEIDRAPVKGNRSESWEDKVHFFGQLKAYCRDHGFKSGWAAMQYRRAYGVWPNDSRLKMAPMATVTPEVAGWVKSQLIRHAKSKAA